MAYNEMTNSRIMAMQGTFETPTEKASQFIKSKEQDICLFLGGSMSDIEIMSWSDDAGPINNIIANASGSKFVKKLKPEDISLSEKIKVLPDFGETYSVSYLDLHNSNNVSLMYNRSLVGEIQALEIAGVKVAKVIISTAPGPAADWVESFTYLLLLKKEVNTLLECLNQIRKDNKKTPVFHTIGARGANDESKVEEYSWDQVILDPEIIKLLKDDFDSFFKRKEWFKSKKLPFRRGYLLHGDPGNGKTSAIKAMMSEKGIDAYTLSLFDKNVGLNDLNSVFELAAENSPSLVVLEDIDRAFPKSDSKCAISIQELLNAIDGIGTKEGIVTIATANNPAALDAAILKRPGRFDRVIKFGNPDTSLRIKYFLSKDPTITQDDSFHEAIKESDGYSFAQLQESYILAGQKAYDLHAEQITGDQLLEAVNTLKVANKGVKKSNSVGF